MINIVYTPNFLHQYKKLSLSLREEIKEKVELFRSDPRHPFLKTHKLSGKFDGLFSFSVNYVYRIVFMYDSKDTVALLSVGDHDVYKA